MFHFSAIQSHLCSTNSADSSLKTAVGSLADEIRQLEQAWKQGLMKPSAACRRQPQTSCVGQEAVEPDWTSSHFEQTQVLLDCHSVDHRTDRSQCTSRELTENHRCVKVGTLPSCCETDMSAEKTTGECRQVCHQSTMLLYVDEAFTDAVQLAQYKSCCRKLDELWSVYLSTSK